MSTVGLFHQSLQAIKSAPVGTIPLAELQSHYRNIAMGYNQVFSKFAVDICGCEEPSDRVKLRKSVWFQTNGLRLKKFETLTNNSALLKRIATMECPVQILSKNVSAPRDESSPSKIILASKLLRSHTKVNEATTCRGCSKRTRCPFNQKVVANKQSKTSLGALVKVLYGMSQSCRLFLKDPDVYRFVISGPEIEAAVQLTEQLSTFLQPDAVTRQLKNVPVADRNAVKAIVTHQIRKNKKMEEERQRESKNRIPHWMNQQPIDETPASTEEREPKVPKFDIDSPDWIAEEKEETDPFELKFKELNPKRAEGTVTRIESLDAIPIPRRFGEAKVNMNASKIVDKQSVAIPIQKSQANQTMPTRGYQIGAGEVTGEGIEYIKPEFMRGKTLLDNPSLANKLWSSASPYIADLNFLRRVPYSEAKPDTSAKKVDPTLASVLANEAPFPKTPDKERNRRIDNDENARFREWKNRKVKIGVLDSRVESTGGSPDFEGSCDIASLPIRSNSLSKDQSVEIISNQEALRTALGNGQGASPMGQLKFPNFPQWAVPEVKDDEVKKLMRPPLDPKVEQRRSERALKKRVKLNRKLEAATMADLAGVWK